MNIEEVIKRLSIAVAISKFETKDYPNCIVMKQDLKTILTAYEKEKETSHYIQSQLDIANAKLVEEKEKNKRLIQCHYQYEEMTGIDLLLPSKEE